MRIHGNRCPAFLSRLLRKSSVAAVLSISLLSAGVARTGWAATKVAVEKTPHGGIQPQAAIDAKGNLHVLYFAGKAAAGDLHYVRRSADSDQFSDPIRVNSQSGSAVATGSIRGGQMALGKDGCVHVAWNGSRTSQGSGGSPQLYARWDDSGTAFEPQRNLMQRTEALDGGGSVTADGQGNVYVAWHGLERGDERGEENRRVWVAHSTDEGKTFSRENPAWTEATGACACCALRTFADSQGSVYLLYRAARSDVNRDIHLLCSKTRGQEFEGVLLHKWKVPT